MSIAMEDGPQLRRITVEEFLRMAEDGLLDSDVRVELIDGVITEMAPPGSPHCAVVDILAERLTLALTGRAITRNQGALVLSDLTLFLPDIALLKRRTDWYRKRNPSGRDAYLVIEVSDTTLRKGRDVKAVYYARHGVPEVWIADIAHETLHFFRDRTDHGYADISSIVRPSVVTLPTLGDTIDLTGLFGPD